MSWKTFLAKLGRYFKQRPEPELPRMVKMSNNLVTGAQLSQIMPAMKEPEEWADVINRILPTYAITGRERVAAFIAQCAHESMQFNRLSENLNYSKAGLVGVFSKYFDDRTAEEYQRKPELIANRVYADRMGNGNESSGDGWKYRGRGVIQLTGKNNYAKFNEHIDADVINDPDQVSDSKEIALRSACWFWYTNNLNNLADSGDFVKLTKRINGGTHGLSEREEFYREALRVL